MHESGWGRLDGCRGRWLGGKQSSELSMAQADGGAAGYMWKMRYTTEGPHRKGLAVAENGGIGCCEWGLEGCGGALGAEMAQLCPLSTALRQLETLFHFLQLVAGVEHYQLKFRSQAAVIDEIVDTTFEVNQAGPGRSQVERAGHWKWPE